jgi:hypothetical protein
LAAFCPGANGRRGEIAIGEIVIGMSRRIWKEGANHRSAFAAPHEAALRLADAISGGD